jgi:hypothetical protein
VTGGLVRTGAVECEGEEDDDVSLALRRSSAIWSKTLATFATGLANEWALEELPLAAEDVCALRVPDPLVPPVEGAATAELELELEVALELELEEA